MVGPAPSNRLALPSHHRTNPMRKAPPRQFLEQNTGYWNNPQFWNKAPGSAKFRRKRLAASVHQRKGIPGHTLQANGTPTIVRDTADQVSPSCSIPGTATRITGRKHGNHGGRLGCRAADSAVLALLGRIQNQGR